MWLLVGAIALAVGASTVGATLLTRTGTGGSTAAVVVKQKGAPEIDLDLGVRTDAEAVALRRAVDLYDQGHRKAAGATLKKIDPLAAAKAGVR